MRKTKKTIKHIFCAFLLAIFISTTSDAQTRQGNIVEYFGKEKVNEISEGSLLHVFKEGLAINIAADRMASISFPVDPVFHRFLEDTPYNPIAGETFDLDSKGNAINWREIEVDTSNTFNDRSLRSAYVVLGFDSPSDRVVIFEASGHSLALINGFPHEGDHYDFGWSLIPLKLKKGRNTFVLKVGRFPRIRARLIEPSSGLLFTSRDMTTPDVRKEDIDQYLGGIRVVNASEEWLRSSKIEASFGGRKEDFEVADIPPLSVLKTPFLTPQIDQLAEEEIDITLVLRDKNEKELAISSLPLKVKSKHEHHKRTFLSDIDHSVQYYSVAPSTNLGSEKQALFLSVHGASVEATNQARAYKKKDWGNLIAPTNRRPFGFAWEDWGRLDAMEVLKDAKSIYEPDPQKIYLTGHSMGGHGTWYLGATYPDHFGAIAPCAGYPDLLAYRNSFAKRLQMMDDAQLQRFGMSREMVNDMLKPRTISDMEAMLNRAGNPSRTLQFKRNYLHHGVYILHGEIDNVVPTFIAREMRETLGQYHNDFTYYEYPEGTHWYGDHSVDWLPIFDFFKQRSIPKAADLKKLEFATNSPGVSASSHFVTLYQQEKVLKTSHFKYTYDKGINLEFENTKLAKVDLSMLKNVGGSISVDGQEIEVDSNAVIYLRKDGSDWTLVEKPGSFQKGPHRNGNFKDAFRHQPVFVYGTNGTPKANEWNYMKAKFDAETFGYRANGRIEVVADRDFEASAFQDRNIVIYGNADNNTAWERMLSHSPVQIRDNEVTIDGRSLQGDSWGTYFIYPRADSEFASVGVVSGTGIPGMKAAYANHYLVNGSSYPDFTLFDADILIESTEAIKCAGFFGNDWSVDKGEMEWK